MRIYHRIPLEEHIRRHICVDAESGCWHWTAGLTEGGYGKIKVDGKTKLAHRVSYEMHFGAIPDGLQIDHKCHNPEVCRKGIECPHRRCCNPSHLEAVTKQENDRRGAGITPAQIVANARKSAKTHCKNGHPFPPRQPGKQRLCSICFTAYQKQWVAEHPGLWRRYE